MWCYISSPKASHCFCQLLQLLSMMSQDSTKCCARILLKGHYLFTKIVPSSHFPCILKSYSCVKTAFSFFLGVLLFRIARLLSAQLLHVGYTCYQEEWYVNTCLVFLPRAGKFYLVLRVGEILPDECMAQKQKYSR